MAKKKLIYERSVYSVFGNFLARAIEIAKEKILTYNFLVDLAIRKKSFNTFLKVQINILERAGWKAFLAIAALVGAGAFVYYGSLSAILASNPLLAFALLSVTGGAAVLIYQNRNFVTASEKVGKRYKIDFDLICSKYPVIEDRANEIEILMNKCVESLIGELFRISLEKANDKYRIGKTRLLETSEVSSASLDNKRLTEKIKSKFVKNNGRQSYSFQSLEDTVKYLSGWVTALKEKIVFLEDDKRNLIDNSYWESANNDAKLMITYNCSFYEAAIKEIEEIQKQIPAEVQAHHVSRLKRLGDTAREISIEWNRVWKIAFNAKQYKDSNFLIFESSCVLSRDLTARMMDLSNVADRLNDYVGRKDPLNQSATKDPNTTVIINGDVVESSVLVGDENSISNKAAKMLKDLAFKTKRKPK